MPKRFCAAHPCGNMVPMGTRYCDDHKYLLPAKQTKAFYLSPAWRRFRACYIGKQPFCAECERHGRLVKTQIVDHIIEIEDGGLLLRESFAGKCEKRGEAARKPVTFEI